MIITHRWCPWGDEPHQVTPEHTHPYKPASFAARRCTCGHREFHVRLQYTGGPVVECTKCGRPNFGATAYETGRFEGRRPARTPENAIPF